MERRHGEKQLCSAAQRLLLTHTPLENSKLGQREGRCCQPKLIPKDSLMLVSTVPKEQKFIEEIVLQRKF